MTQLVFRDDAYERSCDARIVAVRRSEASVAVELDATVFYPMSGGQAGDTGVLRANNIELRVTDTRKGEDSDRVLHLLAPDADPPAIGSPVIAELDWERRHRHMRMHTCMHLLCAVVAAPVTGGRIAKDKSHLDFDIDMAKLDKEAIEKRLNELIEGAHAATPRWIDSAELAANPQLVKTMSVAPPLGERRVRLLEIPGVDLQACGGTHVANTREIGRVQVVRIRSEGKRNKRVTVAFAP
ncbi:MAG: alanyl-tRNA editing protein [Betaproteobacteria bacterium]|nr:alanyl-tRNA editing protein [Betaproteobacteria bacterium]